MMKQSGAQPIRPTGSPYKSCYGEVLADIRACPAFGRDEGFLAQDAQISPPQPGLHQDSSIEQHPKNRRTTPTQPSIPAITLTQPTPFSSAEPVFLQNAYPQSSLPHFQTPWRPPLSYPTPPTTPPLRTVPRPAKDVEAMLNAMAKGNFAIRVFGAAGAAFHQDEAETYGMQAPDTGSSAVPTPRKKTPATAGKRKKVKDVKGMQTVSQTGAKRKRAQSKTVDGEEDNVQKKPMAVRKKVKADPSQQSA